MGNGGGQLGEACRLACACQTLLRQPEVLLRADLGIDVETDHVPLDDGSIRAAHGCRARFDPAIGTVMAPQAVAARIGLARLQTAGIVLLHGSEVVGMDACIQRLHQT
jgi:hypothetical protein